MTATQRRQPRGVPVGGQFVSTAHQEADVALTAERTFPVSLAGVARVSTVGFRDVPCWPAALEGPDVSWTWDDDGLPSVDIHYDHGRGHASFFGPEHSRECMLEPATGDLATDLAIMNYGHAVLHNVDLANNAMLYGTDHRTRAELLEIAMLGAPRGPVVDPGEPGFVPLPERAAARAERALRAWHATTGEIGEDEMKDALTDLLHLARSRGLHPTDFGAIFHRAQQAYFDEIDQEV